MTAPAANVALSHWLRLLWNIAPSLRLHGEQPYLQAGVIHLPPSVAWQHNAAAAAHAAAHLLYSPPRFDGSGAGPIVRALMGLLEDARAEASALRDLPGLARLWRPLHTATPALGDGFEARLQRLARALIDVSYVDADPWIAKGRALFWRDAGNNQPALHTPADVRRAAARLGHDIGQMRLQFNAKTYCPLPAYRDDHRWMWPADVLHAPPPAAAQSTGDHDEPMPEAVGETFLYPEWDRLIARLRPDWCRVIEQAPPDASPADDTGIDFATSAHPAVRRAVRSLARNVGVPQRDEEGDVFDPGALVDRQVAHRLRRAGDPRVYRGHRAQAARASVWLLIDQSESTASVQGEQGQTVLQQATAVAIATADALQANGLDCAISGFNSCGRHAVRMNTVKPFGASAVADVAAAARRLRPGGSTRLGAALRHVTHQLAHAPSPQWVIVLSDGEPYDVDVHDPHYLVDDARHAVHAASRAGVRVVCALLGRAPAAPAQRIFGRTGVQVLRGLDQLPRALQRLISSSLF